MPAVASGDRLGDDVAVDTHDACAVARGRRTHVADADPVDAPSRPERGNVDATCGAVGTGRQAHRRCCAFRRKVAHGADGSVLEQHQALDGLEAETFESGARLRTERARADGLITDAAQLL